MRAVFKNKFAPISIALFLAIFIWLFFIFPGKSNRKIIKQTVQKPAFIGSGACKECHESEYEAWKLSDHYKSMQVAGKQTVLGDFNNAVFESKGFTNKMFKADSIFYMVLENHSGKSDTFEVKYTFGHFPLQQYIIEFPDGRYQCTHVAWDSRENKWFDLYPDLEIHHSEWLHWSGGAQTWNNMCADCHSTNLQKNYHAESDSYHTTWDEINVSCEACHGPGSEHVRLAKMDAKPELINSSVFLGAFSSQQEQMQFCARCHSRRGQLTNSFDFSEHWMQQYSPEILRPGLYFADGQILDEVYVWGSFTQSKMYREGVRCIDCHDPHTYKRKIEGNQLCLQCHDIRVYDNKTHHFHEPGSQGAQCESCHMPGRYYMVNDYRPDHSFRVPRPDLSVKYDVPNACNKCHEEQSAQWASDWVNTWYGDKREFHFSEILLKAAHLESSPREIAHFVNIDTIPDIARATALFHLENYAGREALQVLLDCLQHPSALVRRTAVEGLGLYNSEEFKTNMVKSLFDTEKMVRIAAYNALSGVDISFASAGDIAQYNRVGEEFFETSTLNSDFPSGKLYLGHYFQRAGEVNMAQHYYEMALRDDNYQNMARMNLSLIYNSQNQNQKAAGLLKKVIEQEPEYEHAYYSLGLLYAEMNKADSAIIFLEKSIEKNLQNAAAYYNLGLLYQQQNQAAKAESTFLKGLKNIPGNERLLYASAYFYLQEKNREQANRYALELNRLFPGRQEYIRLLEMSKE